MSFNDYLDPLVNVEGATLISTILLVHVDVGRFSPNKYVPTSWAKHTKTTIRGASSLGNPSCSKSDFSPPLIVAAAGRDLAAPRPVEVCPLPSASRQVRRVAWSYQPLRNH